MPSGPASIASDQADYPPGGTVTLTGSNWFAGETVHIFVNDDFGSTWNRNVDVTANSAGEISDSFTLPNWFVANYRVVATGALSGSATTTFTDGNVKYDVAPSGDKADFIETLYLASADCTGTVKSTNAANNKSSGTVGVGSNESLKLEASASTTSSSSRTFVAWSNTDTPAAPFAVIGGSGRNHLHPI